MGVAWHSLGATPGTVSPLGGRHAHTKPTACFLTTNAVRFHAVVPRHGGPS